MNTYSKVPESSMAVLIGSEVLPSLELSSANRMSTAKNSTNISSGYGQFSRISPNIDDIIDALVLITKRVYCSH